MEKKRCKVIMLPTNKAENCILKDRDGRMRWEKRYFTQEYLNSSPDSITGLLCPKSYHIYITSDDKIEAGDWCLFFWDGNKEGELGQVGSEPQQYLPSEGHTLNRNLRKIIATTNPKLHSTRLKDCPINPEDNMVSVRGVSKPSQSFIEEYCRKEGIDEVDVEYEKYHDGNFINDGKTHAFTALLRPEVSNDNIINIQPIKDSWTVENLPDLLNRFCKDHSLHRGLQITDDMIKEWLEKQ